MRIVFAGTPEFAAHSLRALMASRHSVVAVLAQPDRPVGRGLKVQPGAVKRSALAAGVPVYQPDRLDTPEVLALLQGLSPDVMVVAAYGMLLPGQLLGLPKYGAINIHASLLPRWRGAAPIQRAIQAGDHMTGISIMQMDAGLDTGNVVLVRPCPIHLQDNAKTLQDRLAELGAQAIVEALEGLGDGTLVAVPQSTAGVTYARKVGKEEALLDWSKDAMQLANEIRAFNPSPVSRTPFGKELIKVWEAYTAPCSGNEGMAGTVFRLGEDGVWVSCGKDVLVLTVLQRAGGKPMKAAEFIKGFPLQAGSRLGA